MKLYLDDDIAQTLLVRLLRQAGHDVVTPADLGLAGQSDPIHLLQAMREQRAIYRTTMMTFASCMRF